MNVHIRMAAPGDAAQIAAIYAPFVRDLPVSFELEPPSPDEMERRITSTLRRFPWLVCEKEGTLLGYLYAGAHRERAAYQWSVETAVYIHSHARRSGVGRALYTSLFGILALQGFYNAYAGITLPNAASVGLHEAMGFERIGVYRAVGYKLGCWHDVGWWQRPLRERTGEVTAPVALSEVTDREEYAATLAAGAGLVRT